MAIKPSGHIEQLPSGSWRVKVYAGKDPLTGREVRFRVTCKTELAAQIELGKLLEQVTAGRQPGSGATAGCRPNVCKGPPLNYAGLSETDAYRVWYGDG